MYHPTSQSQKILIVLIFVYPKIPDTVMQYCKCLLIVQGSKRNVSHHGVNSKDYYLFETFSATYCIMPGFQKMNS